MSSLGDKQDQDQDEEAGQSRSEERKQIDLIRRRYERLPCKTPDEQEILLTFYSRPSELPSEANFECAILTIRSGARNALSGRMISQLTERLDEVEQWIQGHGDETRTTADANTLLDDNIARGPTTALGLLLVGANGTFCSGSDLVSVRGTLGQSEGLQLARLMQYNVRRIQALPLISVAHLEGYALGGGAELALAPDFRLMSAGAQIGFVHARVGVCCGWGGGTRLVHLVGPNRALELLSSGRLVGAHEALALGLCNGIVAAPAAAAAARPSAGLEEALDFVRSHSIGWPRTGRAIKRLIDSAARLARPESLQVEAQLFASTWGQAAHLRALEADIRHNGKRAGRSKADQADQAVGSNC